MTSLAWEGCVNVRDLGGLPTEDGRRTRLGGVVRSDNVRRLTDEGWRALAEHGVQRIVDLRFPEELAEDQPRDVDIDVVNVSVLGAETDPEYVKELDAHLAVNDVADHYVWSYVDFLERYRERFGQAFAAIADADGTVVVHCFAGKDRTGLVAAVLLRLAGVDHATIGADYAVTAENLRSRWEAWLREARDEEERAKLTKLQHTPAEAMARVVQEIERRYGDVASYLRAAGLTDAQVDRLRERLVAP
ncbi:MAG: protein tyrosine/serine phosphatase [Actinomycetia bacterium]|nr:protein tyrosine/serine phosphatase [Actinomycetes bacterium]